MRRWNVSAQMTISVHTEVDAATEEEAIAIAECRDVGGMTIHAFCGGPDEEWQCSDLDGMPLHIRAEQAR